MNFIAIIPARNSSKRLPGKPLVDIAGKPMIIHVMERALESGASRVIIATDHLEVKRAVEEVGGEAHMTRSDHNSGTERLAEIVEKCKFPENEIIVNIQGDEPLLLPDMIHQVVHGLANNQAAIATLGAPINNTEEAFNPNTVKVVCDKDGYALYFSRSVIPWYRDPFTFAREKIGNNLLRHVGIYAYRAGFIRQYMNWKTSPLERIEMLEQLRVLWNGEKIHVDITSSTPKSSVDTIEDLEQVRRIFADHH
ncbi:3-deoxy-manno-octulosonate cytidylyltransferase [Candidatus Profftia tarda]|uniref:3-deoxy-manno-octulosonate cytidylyltransferase n=1 Tax=Candidatus Profftia tarda TaxID=1177216 RepID=A0A8E4F0B4_9ENTR|nr:3-deoxy-manno-octulosonate cytidylyltransferase [Candidatus Profftia tarda]CAD6508144.1 3-deoxy-manno-octulosonate cytidylyltransferase [Candidatus Profftia tarda]